MINEITINIREAETDEQLAAHIISLLDPNNPVESYLTILNAINNDPKHPGHYHIRPGGPFRTIMTQLMRERKITYLPVQVGNYRIGWYRGKIDIPINTPTLIYPKNQTKAEWKKWELHQFGSKERIEEIITEEAKRLFSSLNPSTGMFWTLQEIGNALGRRSRSVIFTLLKKAGVNIRRVPNFMEVSLLK